MCCSLPVSRSIFRFGLPSPEHRIGLPVGKHVFVYASVKGETVVRAYTPISGDAEKGRLDMLIKVRGRAGKSRSRQGRQRPQLIAVASRCCVL